MVPRLIDRIGNNSTLDSEDKQYLRHLSNWLYDNGWYTKANYVYQLVENSSDVDEKYIYKKRKYSHHRHMLIGRPLQRMKNRVRIRNIIIQLSKI